MDSIREDLSQKIPGSQEWIKHEIKALQCFDVFRRYFPKNIK